MPDKRERQIFILLCISVVSIDASKCPETRKPHVTSCTIFYNCINLPDGGYVWAPAKCSEGLVFQPYLRICVLPGDTWTCDDLLTEKTILTDYYEKPQLIDPSKTSYHEYEHDSTSPNVPPSEVSAYTFDETSQLGNIRPHVDPYPLIESHSNNNVSPTITKDTKISVQQNNDERTSDYLYRYFQSQHKLHTRLTGVTSINNGQKNKYTWLRAIIDRILLYENYEDYRKSDNCQSSINDNMKKNVDKLEVFNDDMLNYLVQSYVLGTRNPMRIKTMKKTKKNEKSTTTPRIEQINEHVFTTISSVDQSIDTLIDGTKTKNNIIVIEGNLGEREYITVEKYKMLSSQIKLRVIEILPCARGVRLPNITDCTRYYTCDPDNANIVKFSCSSRTAFNNYNRVCDVQRYRECSRQINEQQQQQEEATTLNVFTTETTSMSEDLTEIPVKNEPCRNTGKFVDNISDKHYYVCYSSQANPSKIESLRMTCPNDLIFCQDRRVCSTRKRCYDSWN